MRYDLTPNVIYYIGTGDYKAGTAVDVTTLGAISTIDFTKAKPGQTNAAVTQNNDGTWSDPTFSYPSKEKPHSA